MSPKIVILAFDGMEALDFAGPIEVFTTAARMAQRMGLGQDPWCTVQCVAASDAPVAARAGLRVLPDFSFARFASVDDRPADILLIPGGVVDTAPTRWPGLSTSRQPQASLHPFAQAHSCWRLQASSRISVSPRTGKT